MTSRKRVRSRDTELARDLDEALGTVPLFSVTTVPYTATGSTASTIDLLWGIKSDKVARNETSGPQAALVIRVVDTTAAAGNPGDFRVALNFEFVGDSSGNHTVKLYEPEGLTANTEYELTILWVG